MSVEAYEHEHPLDPLAIERAKGSEEEEAEPGQAAMKEQEETVASKN
jgi:hypothetical protein